MPERVLIDISGKCNLRCPMCLVHGLDDEGLKSLAIGDMSFDDVQSIVNELPEGHSMIQPNMWGEPTLAPNFREHVMGMKARKQAIALNTNGLTLNEKLQEFVCDAEVDSVFFSIDAITNETLKKVRGVAQLEKIERNLLSLLKTRGDRKLPRIGATFTLQEANEQEVEDFIDRWVPHVDVVRIGSVFEDGKLRGVEAKEARVPCSALYTTLPIHYDGDALICCLDGLAEHRVGNVIKDGVEAVWNGDELNRVRRLHEEGRWDEVPLCKDCNAWAGHLYEEVIEERAGVKVLVRRSAQFEYYNRIDRLNSWTGDLKGHLPPDEEALKELVSP
tara:strand:- start:223 stop:1218 length:996 start_codon:yes stop_codon:yes gene_type:complete